MSAHGLIQYIIRSREDYVEANRRKRMSKGNEMGDTSESEIFDPFTGKSNKNASGRMIGAGTRSQ